MEFSKFAYDTMERSYAHTLPHGRKELWPEVAERTATNVLGAVNAPREIIHRVAQLIADRKFMPGGRYLAASGRPFHQTQNCVLMRPEDTREGWGEHSRKVVMASMTGAGLGGVYSDLRPKDTPIKKTGGVASGPCALMIGTNELGRMAKQGGHRRAALWAGLHWNHPDVFEFIALKQWDDHTKAMKAVDYNYPAQMDHTNISVILDDDFFEAFHTPGHQGALMHREDKIDLHAWATKLYWQVVRQMMENGEPGFSIDVGPNRGENLRNACTEITSHDPDDICNLGSVNMANITSIEEMREVVELGIMFLLAGTVYSHLPYPEIEKTRAKNRRLGLGLMGLHEFLLKRGEKYGPSASLEPYMYEYTRSCMYAEKWATKWGLSIPIKTRAIAPTGTIGIVAETTTGIEPIFCAAYKRRYMEKGNVWKYQYVLDPCAKRLVEQGMDPESIEDAYSINVERRLAFQAWTQQYVDHAISSTINLPAWGSVDNNEAHVESFGNTLMKYLPQLRGITAYPDGSRGGQPLNPVHYNEASKFEGEVFVEGMSVCDITGGGQCGS